MENLDKEFHQMFADKRRAEKKNEKLTKRKTSLEPINTLNFLIMSALLSLAILSFKASIIVFFGAPALIGLILSTVALWEKD